MTFLGFFLVFLDDEPFYFISTVNIIIHHFFRDAGPKCPVDNERLSEAQVSECLVNC